MCYLFFLYNFESQVYQIVCVCSVYLMLHWNESGKVGLCLDVNESTFEQGKKKFLLLIAEDEKEFQRYFIYF